MADPKRFDALTEKIDVKQTDFVPVLDEENKVVPSTGGAPVPDLKKMALTRFLIGRVAGEYGAIEGAQNKGLWDVGTTYNYGDIVTYDPTGSMGLLLSFFCGADNVVGVAPDLTYAGNGTGIWAPIKNSGGAHIGEGSSGANGLGIGEDCVVGAADSLAVGTVCRSGLKYNDDCQYLYKGAYALATTYYRNEVVYVAGFTGFYWCVVDNTTETPGAGSDWALIYDRAFPWNSGDTFNVGDCVFTEETIDEKTVIFLFYVTGDATIPTKPNYRVYSGPTYYMSIAFVVDHFTLTNQGSFANLAMCPSLPIQYYVQSENGPGTMCCSAACFLSLSGYNKYIRDRAAFVVFPLAADNPANSYNLDYAMTNAPQGIWELFLIGLTVGAADPLAMETIFGGGCISAGFMASADKHSAMASGFSVSARHIAAQVFGSGIESEWLGEMAHSSGPAVYNNIIPDPENPGSLTSAAYGVMPIRSKLELTGYTAEDALESCSLADPASSLFAGMGMGSLLQIIPSLNDALDRAIDESAVYVIKATVTGRVMVGSDEGSLEQGLVVYEGDIVIDMTKSENYRLAHENWTELYKDSIPTGAFVEPYISLGTKYNELRIQVEGPGIGAGAISWTAHLDIKKTLIYEGRN